MKHSYLQVCTPILGTVLGIVVSFGTLLVLGIHGRDPLGPATQSPPHNCDWQFIDALKRMAVDGTQRDTIGNAMITYQKRDQMGYASREEMLRFRWLGTVVFQTGLMVALTVYCIVLIIQYAPPKRHALWCSACIGAGIVFGVIIAMIQYLSPLDNSAPLHVQLFALMKEETNNLAFDVITGVFNAWGGVIGWYVATVLTLFMLSRPKGKTQSARVNSDFRRLLFASTAFLVAVTIQIFCEFSWASALFNERPLAEMVRSMAASASFAYGAMFTVIAGFIFIPVALYLDADKKFDLKSLSDLLAILAPLLAAIPLSNLFN